MKRLLMLGLVGFLAAGALAVEHIEIGPNPNGDTSHEAFIPIAVQRFKPNGAMRVHHRRGFYPMTANDYKVLGGNGLIDVMFISQDKAELPVARLYLTNDAGETVELQRVTYVLRDTQGSEAIRILGPYSEYAIYLMPLKEAVTHPKMVADWAVTRTGYPMGSITISPESQALFSQLVSAPSRKDIDRYINSQFPTSAAYYSNSN